MHTSYLYYNIYCIAFSAFSGPHVGLDSNLKNTLLSTATVTIVYTVHYIHIYIYGRYRGKKFAARPAVPLNCRPES
jgi:hypothetical protein